MVIMYDNINEREILILILMCNENNNVMILIQY